MAIMPDRDCHPFQCLDEDELTCCVCMEANVEMTPCGHSLCTDCYFQLQNTACPMCRVRLPDIDGTQTRALGCWTSWRLDQETSDDSQGSVPSYDSSASGASSLVVSKESPSAGQGSRSAITQMLQKISKMSARPTLLGSASNRAQSAGGHTTGSGAKGRLQRLMGKFAYSGNSRIAPDAGVSIMEDLPPFRGAGSKVSIFRRRTELTAAGTPGVRPFGGHGNGREAFGSILPAASLS
eukprot:TRINITY_DN69615_c0_g2_i1.p1 TRINITY_DN69615_c0_g2~~TRINITY_DN69615_c0_g2_i1.p1  ORF type:complete len:238 (+),score=43.04 TRINITY_DN69615_c0_g2_i1:70-783(+)